MAGDIMIATTTTGSTSSIITWQGWSSVFDVTPLVTSAIISDPWLTWNQTSTTSLTITDDLWSTWNGIRLVEEAINRDMRARDPALDQRLREQDAAHQRQREADRLVYATRMRQERAKRLAAEERAEKLLMSILSSAQQAQYRAERRFTVHLPNGHHYMIRKGRHGNIERINERGKALENLCVHVAPHEIPDCDNMAAQKLMLETNEQELRGIANITRIAA